MTDHPSLNRDDFLLSAQVNILDLEVSDIVCHIKEIGFRLWEFCPIVA